jgi:hypothetical protein
MKSLSTTLRGYGHKHQETRRRLAPLVDAGLVPVLAAASGSLRESRGIWATMTGIGLSTRGRNIKNAIGLRPGTAVATFPAEFLNVAMAHFGGQAAKAPHDLCGSWMRRATAKRGSPPNGVL